MFDLALFTDLVDLYVYLPPKDLNKDSNNSATMHYILSSNSKGAATAKKSNATEKDIELRRALEMIWIRIEERFKHMHAAFRFLDINYNNSISFAEFTQGLESLKVKMSVDDQFVCFKYLDKDNKQFLNYHDFCNITPERRRGIDPA